MTKTFTHLLQITPLGLLYGSAGGFLSPENLVGRSGNKFPPSSATVSGLYAQVNNNPEKTGVKTWLLPDLCLAGPFWAKQNNLQNFYVPTPFIYSVEKNATKIKYKLSLKSFRTDDQPAHWEPKSVDSKQEDQNQPEKFSSDTWLAIADWNNNPQQVYESPWKYLPHLHPRLQDEQRHTQEGDLFLENAVQVDPHVSLIYLTNHKLENGWYRFGGEGHLVEVQCHELDSPGKDLFGQKIEKSFALITPAVWGSNRLSYRFPQVQNSNPSQSLPEWEHDALITERPQPFRYRLGGKLSRGRYAVPAGSVYILKEALKQPWYDWPEEWFPTEAYSFKRWGCGLALPLPI